MTTNLDKIPKKSENLKLEINNFKNKFLNKTEYFTCERDIIGVLMAKNINILNNFILLNLKKFKNNFIIRIYNSIRKRSRATSNLLSKFELLEKKLDNQNIILERSFDLNSKLQKEIDLINIKFNDQTIRPSIDLSYDKSMSIGHNSDKSNIKIDFYQEENLRLGSELVETKKKFEILKKEIEKYEDQRSNLISKINSVNEAINDTNVLTNVFDNDVKQKINVTDHNMLKLKDENKLDLNEKVKNIFAK
tara:strand:- start:169 stop:915 length:747 start_codon:yes stop_codon:yes gene_type:complete